MTIKGAGRKKMKKIGNEPVGYLFILPFFLFFFFMIILPICTGIANSFTNYDLYKTHDFIGLENYKKLLTDTTFRIAVKNTLTYSILYIVPTMVLGFFLGLLMCNESNGYKVLRAGFYIPNITSMVCASAIWLWIFDPTAGAINQVLRTIGLPTSDWLKDPQLAMGCVVFVSVWKSLGYCMLIYLSGLKGIPTYLYEAAAIDGVTYWQKLRYITIPMLQPTTFFLFITSCIASFNVFEQVNVLTNGGPLNSTTTIMHQIYIRGFTQFNMGYASAMSVVLLIFVVIITLINFKFGNQGQDTDMG